MAAPSEGSASAPPRDGALDPDRGSLLRSPAMDLAAHFLADSLKVARHYKQLAEKALAQVEDGEFFTPLDGENNSAAVVVKHLGGNLRSRWRDFLSSDGEKPDRDRDGEFEVGEGASRRELMALWEEGWGHLVGTLSALAPEDVGKSVTIRGEPHTVVEAIHRQLAHTAYHVGQIVVLARHFRGADWQTLSIARGRSAEFNDKMRQRGGRPG
jgi:Protein of unknown function (DUF1572)